MRGFREFRDGVKQEAQRSQAPSMRSILQRGSGRSVLAGHKALWALAATTAVLLASVPVFEAHLRGERKLAETKRLEQARRDAELMREVNAALARDVPRAMSVLWDGE